MRRVKFVPKHHSDGRVMLNLACGTKLHREWNNIDFSPLLLLARHQRLAYLLKSLRILSLKRYERVNRMDQDIIRWDLRKGIPFDDRIFDVVYHSHFLEHLTIDSALLVLQECYRVLKNRGVIRVVVPDLEVRCRRYIDDLDSYEDMGDEDSIENHKKTVGRLIGQMTIQEAAGTREQRYLLRKIERVIRGTTDRTGDLHRWMYDRVTLRALLQEAGFIDVSMESAATSRVWDWPCFGLDTREDGLPHKHDSIYIEAMRG